MIVFNVVFLAVFVCLIKPRMLSPYIGGKVLSRGWFAAALLILTAIGPYGPASLPTQSSPRAIPNATSAELPPWVIAVPPGSASTSVTEESMVAPAASSNADEAAAFAQ